MPSTIIPAGSGTLLIGLAALLIAAVLILVSAVRIVKEYERGVIFRLGRLVGARGPGLILLIPIVERMKRVDLRLVALDAPSQEAMTRDNVTVTIDAVVYFQVIDPVDAIVQVADFARATSLMAQTTLRSVLGQFELDRLLSERDHINRRLQQLIDEQVVGWGVKVSAVELRGLELPPTMQRAMARQAMAQREKRAKVIHARGELEASRQIANAAAIFGSQAGTLQLRYLQALAGIAVERHTTVIFPLPIDLLRGLISRPRSNHGTVPVDPDGTAPEPTRSAA
jgi:regulator of protease activity HflC (stomatin/prohibitin superfamily)